MRRKSNRLFALAALAFVGLGTVSCATHRRFVDRPVVWVDDDKRPVPAPEEYFSPMYWDVVDKTLFRPLSHFFLFEVDDRAANANALEEVPNSSWFTNRLSVKHLDADRIARGPCGEEGMSDKTWFVKSGKVNGANPGFVVQDSADGRYYLLKFDSEAQPERATTADVIGSKIYWAAGFSTPCNRVQFFDPAQIVVADDATKKDNLGRKTALTSADVDKALASAPRLPDGRLRGSSSLFLPGKPLGPLTYDGIRSDDLNDAIEHEERRELRGSRLLGAWLNHFDAREQNTFSSFVSGEDENLGYVQHHIIDFGDCFGSLWESDAMSRRFGMSYYFDIQDVAFDAMTFGLVERKWEKLKKYPRNGEIFGYYGVDHFVPSEWKVAYPNVAFDEMRLDDGFWAAKIISRFSNATIARLVKEGRLSHEKHARFLERVLIGRRDLIVHEYLDAMSAFDAPLVNGAEVCAEDLMVAGSYVDRRDSFYEFRIGDGEWSTESRVDESKVCFTVPQTELLSRDYLILEARIRRTYQSEAALPVDFHFASRPAGLRLVGIERHID